MSMNVTPKMLDLLRALYKAPSKSMAMPYRRGVANTVRACQRWGLLYYHVDKGWLALSKFGIVYVEQRDG